MWKQSFREQLWDSIEQPWDLVVIGGGITGVGVLREAANAGLRCLLLEASDFAFGTSSRSSKLVHGGFRYMRSGQFDITRESVRERQWMLHHAPGLVTPLPFILPSYESYSTPDWQFHLGVILYDLFGRKWKHSVFSPQQVRELLPALNQYGLLRAYRYEDAAVDDARLVLRVLQEALKAGGQALNYARVETLLRNCNGKVCGVVVHDESTPKGRTVAVQARVIVNATGPWTDHFRELLDAPTRIRQTRGSHLVFFRERMPLAAAVTLMHPDDNRAMFAIPWERVCLVGTTDLDHHQGTPEPYTSEQEIAYILKAIQSTLPSLEVEYKDVLATFAGVRPIVSSGTADPSAESRAHAVWEEDGLFTITGGKLTTFRVMAASVLKAARTAFAGHALFPTGKPFFDTLPVPDAEQTLPPETLLYLAGRYGADTPALLAAAQPGELQPVANLSNLWAELRWAARAEAVVHLDDLLLRRVRLGLQLPQGGMDLLGHIRNIVQPELSWDDDRWEQEEARYRETWQLYYSPSPGTQVDLRSSSTRLPLKV
jgi:glycerol-3-phosphate dehydrogenase